MRIKTLATIRSTFRGFEGEGEAMAEKRIPAPKKMWLRSELSEQGIQALVTQGLLKPKVEVEWKATLEEAFPTENTNE